MSRTTVPVTGNCYHRGTFTGAVKAAEAEFSYLIASYFVKSQHLRYYLIQKPTSRIAVHNTTVSAGKYIINNLIRLLISGFLNSN